jgi:4-amino-4-deoxy-L-arabinose transferase-like glycosyltransferase
MASIIFIFFMVAVFTGIGWPLIKRLDGGGHLSLIETGSFAFVVGALFLYFGVFLIGTYRLDDISMWGLATIMTAMAVSGWRRIPLKHSLDILAGLPTFARLHPWSSCLWIAILVVGGSTLIQGMAPPNSYDSMSYHLAVPKYSVERGFISIPWDRAIAVITFPQLGGHISRFALTTMNDGVAQMLHGLFGLLAAVVSGLIIRRLGYGLNIALIAALFFLVSRVVVWQMGTVETDVPLAAFSTLSMLAYLVFRRSKTAGINIIFGLMIGSAIAFKLLGFPVALAFAPMMIADLWGRKIKFSVMSIGPLVAFLVIAPHLILTFNLTGNFFYPFFASILNPGAFNPIAGAESNFGTGRGIADFILAPWTIFVTPMHYYDGMVFGAPFLLALVPLAFMRKGSFLIWRGVLSFVFIYFVLWFWTFGQQTRFLLPLLPYLCGLSALGVSAIWDLSSNIKLRRAVVIIFVSLLGINQALFVGIYTLLRVPPAIGLMDAATYHEKTPALTDSFYGSCSYIAAN